MFFVLRPPPLPISFPMVRPLEILAQLHKVSEIAPKSLFLCVNRRPFRYGFSAGSKAIWFRACLHGGGRPQIGEVTWGGSPHLSCKRDQIKMRDFMDRKVTPSKRFTSTTRGPPPPCKHSQALLWFILCTSSIHCTRLPRESGNNACAIFILAGGVGEGVTKMYHERCANVGLTFSWRNDLWTKK